MTTNLGKSLPACNSVVHVWGWAAEVVAKPPCTKDWKWTLNRGRMGTA
jgi:hypothetical protein